MLEIKNEPLPQVLRQLEMKTDYRFLYLNDDLRGYTFTGDLTLKDINSTMTQLLDGKPLPPADAQEQTQEQSAGSSFSSAAEKGGSAEGQGSTTAEAEPGADASTGSGNPSGDGK